MFRTSVSLSVKYSRLSTVSTDLAKLSCGLISIIDDVTCLCARMRTLLKKRVMEGSGSKRKSEETRDPFENLVQESGPENAAEEGPGG